MKRFRIFATAVLFSVCAVMSAQNEEKPEYEYTFNPHLFIQGNVGLQYTLGEVSFFDLTSFNAQLGVGYEFTPSIAARFSVNGWQSRGGMTGDFLLDGKERYWDWKYINPSVDVLVDLTNLIGGFNPERKISAGVLAGIGANFVFSNENAEKVKADLVNNYQTQYNVDICADVMEFIHLPGHEDHTTIDERRSLFWPFRLGAFMDYHINDNWSANLELQANTLSDQYNSKKTWNTDWYFNALIGVKYCFGPTYDKKAKEKMVPVSEAADYAECEPVETVVEKVVEKPQRSYPSHSRSTCPYHPRSGGRNSTRALRRYTVPSSQTAQNMPDN